MSTVETSSAICPSSAPTITDDHAPWHQYSTVRRYVILVIFCCAQFLDAFNNAVLFSAIPDLIVSLNMSEAESTWIISAFQLTFASFLLISGRISDLYNAKIAFIVGVAGLGAFSLGAGFAKSKIPLIVLRALSGIAASLTIPSALSLLVNIFTEPTEQARALGIYGGCGAVGNVFGLFIGAIFVQFASWPWVFWFVTLVCGPLVVVSLFLVPSPKPKDIDTAANGPRWKSLDLGGVSILTVALILFIFAVTSGGTSGWATAGVLAPLIISVFMVGGFFYYEAIIPAEKAAIPPRTWFLPNFIVLFFTALIPYLWWIALFMIYNNLWQDVYHWSAISVAVHMLPIGVLAFVTSFTGPLSRIINSKWLILLGEGLVIIGTILLVFDNSPARYWPFAFPAFFLGSAGIMLIFSQANIAIFRSSPPSMAGTVGAIFNGALQLGSAVGLAAVGSIEASVEASHGDPDGYAGRAAAMYFLLGIVVVEFLSMLVFYRIDRVRDTEALEQKETTSGASVEYAPKGKESSELPSPHHDSNV